MYVNDRDQINYHGFLTALRTMHGYLLREVSTGICCESGMNRFEKGNRVAEKLVRDRLTARLGVSCEKYEDYLQPKEYARWEQRLRIIKAIQKRNLKVAKQELRKYEDFPNLNRTNQQFVEAMRYMILILDGATEEELYVSIEKAVKLTVPNLEKAFEGAHLLADQEINLIMEQMRLETPKRVIRDEKTWRISEYEKLISYMDNSCWEKLQKAKVYPKVAYYICSQLSSKELSEPEIRRGLELCHNAIELLRDTSRLYYFIELTESRRFLATRLMEYGITEEEKSQLEEMLSENNQWEDVFKELYAEYKVSPYMSDFCYLYYENECHNVVEVIETRRNMLGLSRVKLSEGICTEKTIIRMEREGVNPSIELVRRLFDKMGMCAEYRRARVVTTDVNALMLSIEVMRNMNDNDYELFSKNVSKLQNLIYVHIPYNNQVIERLEGRLAIRKGFIKRDTFYNNIVRALEYTIPLKALSNQQTLYLTREEITCITDVGFIGEGEYSDKCRSVVERICSELEREKVDVSKICMYEFMTDHLASYLGDIGKYDKSIQISRIMLKECLRHRRMVNIWTNIYNILWNQEQCTNMVVDTDYKKLLLERCVLLCKLIKEANTAAFFQDKLMDEVF